MRLLGLILLLIFVIGFYLVYQAFDRVVRMTDVIIQGDLYTVEGRYEAAIDAYEQAMAVQPTERVRQKLDSVRQRNRDHQIILAKGREAYLADDYDRVLSILEPIKHLDLQAHEWYIESQKRLFGSMVDSLVQQGMSALTDGKESAGFDVFQQALRYNPAHSGAWDGLVEAHQKVMLERMKKDLSTPQVTRREPPRTPPRFPEPPTPKDDLSYQVIDRQVIDQPEATTIRTFLISQAEQRQSLETIMNSIYLRDAYQLGFRYRDYASDIEVRIYRSEAEFMNDYEGWVAYLEWNRNRDGGSPRVFFRREP